MTAGESTGDTTAVIRESWKVAGNVGMRGHQTTLQKLVPLGSILRIISVVALIVAAGTARASVSKSSNDGFLPLDGELLYRQLCASCHGESGRGNGPAAAPPALPPADLTVLTATNDGTFPSNRVIWKLTGTCNERPGVDGMPTWNQVLGGAYGNEVAARLRIYYLVQYLKTIQGARHVHE
jgi:mono/diheme cytochrome c family protein